MLINRIFSHSCLLPSTQFKSEPSSYRLGAQNYIEAKRRGELPLPPTQTLPGFKTKTPEQEEINPAEESADSEATELYEPPTLPDETPTDNTKKGKR